MIPVSLTSLFANIGKLIHPSRKDERDPSPLDTTASFESSYCNVSSGNFNIFYHPRLRQSTLDDVCQLLNREYGPLLEYFEIGYEPLIEVLIFPDTLTFQLQIFGQSMDEGLTGCSGREGIAFVDPDNPGPQYTYETMLEVIRHGWKRE